MVIRPPLMEPVSVWPGSTSVPISHHSYGYCWLIFLSLPTVLMATVHLGLAEYSESAYQQIASYFSMCNVYHHPGSTFTFWKVQFEGAPTTCGPPWDPGNQVVAILRWPDNFCGIILFRTQPVDCYREQVTY